MKERCFVYLFIGCINQTRFNRFHNRHLQLETIHNRRSPGECVCFNDLMIWKCFHTNVYTVWKSHKNNIAIVYSEKLALKL